MSRSVVPPRRHASSAIPAMLRPLTSSAPIAMLTALLPVSRYGQPQRVVERGAGVEPAEARVGPEQHREVPDVAHLELDERLVGAGVVAPTDAQRHRHRRHQEGQDREADEQGHQPTAAACAAGGSPTRAPDQCASSTASSSDRTRLSTMHPCSTRVRRRRSSPTSPPSRPEVASRAPDGRPSAWVSAIAITGFVLRLAVLLRPFPVVERLFVPDDTYYTLTIARSLARGDGPSTGGHVLTSGFQPLLGFLLVPVHWLVDDLDPSSRIDLALLLADRHRDDPAARLDRVPPRGPGRRDRRGRGVGAVAARRRDGDGRAGDVARDLHGRRADRGVDPGRRRPHPGAAGSWWASSPDSRCSPGSTCCCSSRSSRCGSCGVVRAASSGPRRSAGSSSSPPGGSTARSSSARRSRRAGAAEHFLASLEPFGSHSFAQVAGVVAGGPFDTLRGFRESLDRHPGVGVLVFAVIVVLLAALAWWWATTSARTARGGRRPARVRDRPHVLLRLVRRGVVLRALPGPGRDGRHARARVRCRAPLGDGASGARVGASGASRSSRWPRR